MKLRDFQLDGVKFLQERSRAYLCDEMGLGKTAQAICAADRIGAKRILVICPSSLLFNWRKEFKLWQHVQRTIAVHESGMLISPLIDVTIINYDKLLNTAVMNQMMTQYWDLLILDEAHRLKNHTAKRTVRVLGPKHDGELGIASRCRNVWWLSGTPAPNNSSELYTALKFMKEWTGSFWQFQREFCVLRQTSFGMKVVGNKNSEQIRGMIQRRMKRRTALQVLKELPPITYCDVALTPQSVVSTAAKNEIWYKFFRDRDINPFDLSDDDMISLLKDKDGDLAKIRHMIGVTKAPEIAQLVTDELDGAPKVLVFAWHRTVIETLANALKRFNPAVITGETPNDLRQVEVDRFQTDPECRVFIGNILAAGEGITLTEANVVVFAEQSWVPKDNAQAAKRAHRIGQKRPVLVKFCSFPGTLDDLITKSVARKTELLTSLELS